MQRVRTSLVAAGAAGLGLAIGGAVVAVAGIPSADGTITSCYKKSGGALRIIDGDTTNCKKGEAKLTWSQQGAPGEDGADGVSGYEFVREQGEVVETSPTLGNDFVTGTVECPMGKVVVGGGGNGVGFITTNGQQISAGLADMRASFPIEGDVNSPAEWAVRFGKGDGTAFAQGEGVSYTLFAICVDAS